MPLGHLSLYTELCIEKDDWINDVLNKHEEVKTGGKIHFMIAFWQIRHIYAGTCQEFGSDCRLNLKWENLEQRENINENNLECNVHKDIGQWIKDESTC